MNIPTILIGLGIAILIALALRYTIRKAKKGECAGCSCSGSCSDACHCKIYEDAR